MKISAIIPCLWDVDRDYAKLCVESLRESTKDSPHQWDIILVTNGSKDDVLIKDIKGITIHLNTKDQGQCVAVNMGASVADGDYLFVSNADMYYAPGWSRAFDLRNRPNQFDFYPVFSPNLVEPTNNAGSAEPFLKFDGGYTLDEFKREEVDKFIDREVHNNKNYLVEPGFNLPFFIRTDVWRTLGGYDTNYDPWGASSDTDLQMKIELAGIKPHRFKSALVYHFSNKSGTFDFSQPQRHDHWQNNFDYLKSKWGADRDELGSDPWYCKNMLPSDEVLKYKPEWRGRYASKR